ncbi:MAG: type II TA system antitoxin MqsA family protein [Candidatus Binatia bacterium]
MARCMNCGSSRVRAERGQHHYLESGLENIWLGNVRFIVCKACEERSVEIPRVNRLHLYIALRLVRKPTLLCGPEFRFIRKELGMQAKELALRLDLHPVTISKWENDTEAVSPQADRNLRYMYLSQQFAAVKERLEKSLTPHGKAEVVRAIKLLTEAVVEVRELVGLKPCKPQKLVVRPDFHRAVPLVVATEMRRVALRA